jgi:hypothetical protein
MISHFQSLADWLILGELHIIVIVLVVQLIRIARVGMIVDLQVRVECRLTVDVDVLTGQFNIIVRHVELVHVDLLFVGVAGVAS